MGAMASQITSLTIVYASVTYHAAAVRSPYGSVCKTWFLKNLKVLRPTVVVVTNVTATARRSYDSWNQKLQGDRKETGRWPYGDLTVLAVITSLPCGRRKGAVRPPQGRREAAVRFSRHPRQGKNRMPPHGHRKATVRPPYDDRAALRHCGFWKKFNVKLKKSQGLRWPCGVLKTVRSPYGLHKNRKVAVRFWGKRSPYGRRKHAASYMWPWHYSIVYSDADQRKHQSSASLAFVRGIHRGPMNSPQKWPVTRKMFPFDDVIMFIPHSKSNLKYQCHSC